jgi:Helix-turn-helix domain
MPDYAVLLAYVSHGDADGYDIAVSQETIAAEVGCHEDTVDRARRRLVKWGELIRVGRRAHRGYVPPYRFSMASNAPHTAVHTERSMHRTATAKAPHRAVPPIGDLDAPSRPVAAAARPTEVMTPELVTRVIAEVATVTSLYDLHHGSDRIARLYAYNPDVADAIEQRERELRSLQVHGSRA